jgi:cytochrome c biogenesis protein
MQQKSGLLEWLYDKLSSMKLTVTIFLLLALCSVLGTLLPQGTDMEELVAHYGPNLGWWLNALGINDLYRTAWFRLILLSLCLNLIVCSLQRLPKSLKLMQHRDEQINPEKFAKFTFHKEMLLKLPFEEVKSRLIGVFPELFARLEPVDTPDAFGAVAEKGRWTLLVVYAVHASVLMILLGALLGSVFGFKGFMNLAEGETSGEVILGGGTSMVNLPFQIRCDNFDVSFYDTGAPKEFRSDLTVIDRGKPVFEQSIYVNDPLTYEGVTFYQSSYGPILKKAEVELLDRNTGTAYQAFLPYREIVTVPGTQDRVQIMQYQDNFHQFGKAVALVLLRENEEPTGSWILMDMPEFHGNRLNNYQIKVLQAETGHYTGLQVKRDPGVWFVYVGFTIMLVGIGVAFYSSHRKIWVWASPQTKGKHLTRLMIAARPNKNPLAFEQDFHRLCERLQDALDFAEKKDKSHGQ